MIDSYSSVFYNCYSLDNLNRYNYCVQALL